MTSIPPNNLEASIISQGTVLVQIERSQEQFRQIEEALNATIVPHRDVGLGGTYTRFEVVEVQKIINKKVFDR